MGYLFGTLLNNKITVTIGPGGGPVDIAAGTFIDNICEYNATTSYNSNIGTTPGGNQIAGPTGIVAGKTTPLTIEWFFDVATTLYFSGSGSTASTITIYKL